MNKYRALTQNVMINREIPKYKVPFVIFNCKPLVPKNYMKRIKATFIYLIKYWIGVTESIPYKSDIVFKTGNNNYKLIDLNNSSILTVVQSETRQQENALRYRHRYKEFEEIVGVDPKGKWVKGIYYNGHHPILNPHNIRQLKKIKQTFNRLQVQSRIKVVENDKYVDSIVFKSLEIMTKNQHLLKKPDVNYVSDFLYKTKDSILAGSNDFKIYLSLSHGDIKPDNMIEDKKFFRLIDWEFTEYRSTRFDLIKFLTRFPRFGQYLKIGDVENPNVKALEFNKDEPKRYMKLFFLEDVLLRLQQFDERDFASDFTSHIVHSIEKYEQLSKK
ncbi:hypothetical protein [Alteribacter natronophilus]|uniref:hypothetical protein n=1 Tax=Alteribacter natronophilus TaxID=2583810 RepID=UPI00110DA26F|nr:hypothetical protein [Alteribacter natronophilus]TMW70543.1 hypothetical protein FGB90_15235 [Alteribacter natronophilus]